MNSITKISDINLGIQKYHETPGAYLVDVRTPEEYREGHLPGSENVPLQRLNEIENLVDDPQAPIFVHCQSGMRSAQAALMLESMGYTNIFNIGGMDDYTGKVEK